MIQAAWRSLLIAGWAVWWGGLTFYGSVAVPMGTEVVGETVEGFITRQVTVWLNLIAATLFAFLLFNANVERRAGRRFRGLTYTAVFLAIIQVGLFALHPRLERLLNTDEKYVIDQDRFDLLHGVYLWMTAAQWGIGLSHMGLLVWNWQRPRGEGDRSLSLTTD